MSIVADCKSAFFNLQTKIVFRKIMLSCDRFEQDSIIKETFTVVEAQLLKA